MSAAPRTERTPAAGREAAPRDVRLLRRLLGEGGKLLVEHPELASARTWVDLWNLFLHRSRSLDLDDFGLDETAARVWEPLFGFLWVFKVQQ